MPIDDKPPRAWDEGDLRELCAQRRRETQTLDFKGELHLGTDGQKKEVERDALGMATGGGGVIVYGIEEVELSDGAKAAGRLNGLQDGTLRDQLERVLDSRGEPRLPFQLHPEIQLAAGGFVLVLEVFGRRRPHRAQDGRFYARRGMNVRPMTEAEVAEAYRDRFLRDARALEPLVVGSDATALPADVEAHIHRGLKRASPASSPPFHVPATGRRRSALATTWRIRRARSSRWSWVIAERPYLRWVDFGLCRSAVGSDQTETRRGENATKPWSRVIAA